MPDMSTLTVAQATVRTGCLYELKIDGSRMSYEAGNLTSDRMINRNKRYPHVLAEVQTVNWKVRGEMAIPGGTIHQLNKKENWHKAKYFIFDLFELNGKDCSKLSATERRNLIDGVLAKGKFKHLEAPQLFETFDEGWAHVVKNELEGIVTKDADNTNWKTKLLKEEKLKIVGHVAGRAKGAFLVERKGVVGKVSGTSVEFLGIYEKLVKNGEVAYAEIEFAFVTDAGILFQPRLRRIGTLEDLRFT